MPPDGTEEKAKKEDRWPDKFWFNPPYSMEVKTKVGQLFLEIVSECFPKGTQWHKYFNRHTIKLSYSCTNSVATKIA